MRFTITAWRLKYLLSYDGETGIFVWRLRGLADFASARAANTWNARFARKEAGHRVAGRYRNICIDGHTYQAHRLAWLYVNGQWPDHIDHINGDKSDNRIANLRSVSNAENRKNQATRKDNTSGTQGVSWDKRTGRWMAKIQVAGKTINLGRFDDISAAAAARKNADRLYSFHQNHGRTA